MKRIVLALFVILTAAGNASAAIPSLVNYQGILKNASDDPQVGTFNVTFSIYATPSGGSPVWTETQSVTTDAEGLFNVLLGSNTALTDAVFAGPDRYLGTGVSPDGEMTPRTRISSVAYAFRPATVDGATGGQISGMVTVAGIAEGLRIQGPGVGNANEAYMRFIDQVGTSSGYVGDAHPGNTDIYLLSNTGGVNLYTLAGSTLMAAANGNVGIGTTTPDNKLKVVQGVQGSYAGNFSTTGLGSSSFGLVVSAGTNSSDVALKVRNQAQQDLLTVRGNGDLVMGTNFAVAGATITVEGGGISCYAPSDIALTAESDAQYAVWGIGGPEDAGHFTGNVDVLGTLTKNAGSFKIDHPLDPANKYLSHSFVESPDMMNIYNGNVATDQRGYATVTMPDWFEALNRDFRYQLTVIGQFAQAIVSDEIKGNQFSIRTDKPNVKVSWQVTGIRQDAYANEHRIPVEELKPNAERGFYRDPELFSQPEEKQIEWARRPEMMKQKKDARDSASRKAAQSE